MTLVTFSDMNSVPLFHFTDFPFFTDQILQCSTNIYNCIEIWIWSCTTVYPLLTVCLQCLWGGKCTINNYPPLDKGLFWIVKWGPSGPISHKPFYFFFKLYTTLHNLLACVQANFVIQIQNGRLRAVYARIGPMTI